MTASVVLVSCEWPWQAILAFAVMVFLFAIAGLQE